MRRTVWIGAACVALAASACSSSSATGASGGSTSSSTTTSAGVVAPAPSADPSTTLVAPAPSADPSTTLTAVSLQAGDAADGYTFTPYAEGDEVDGQVSLDLCSARFASESQRTARHQVGIRDAANHGVVSTEALLYRDSDAARQAMTELEGAVAACPTTPTKSAVAGAPALMYEVHPAPDTTWPPVTDVDRLAVDLTARDQEGHSAEIMAVFLQRGRLLLAIYIQNTDTAAQALTGHPTVEDLTNRLATAIAALPAAAVA